ncbi:TraB/GumN family protein [Hugenholtzia roseola]|uniref:TraB/GumN family protein n=1 Tax=Hugenholtzia roseola TaxID=1002 RepID=UPI00041BA2EC|nr:TraB/GumN family protein [Hugenholtzia roseola]
MYFPILSLFFLGFAIPPKAAAQLLWEIKGNGLKKSSYLFGTIHMGEKRAYAHVEKVMPYIEQTEVFAGELDLNLNALESVSAIMPLMFMKGDTTLETLLDSAQYQQVRKQIKEDMPLLYPMVDKIKPIFLMVFLSEAGNQKPTLSPTGADSTKKIEPPLDLYLQEIARGFEKEVIGLETLSEQLTAFTAISLEEQAQMLIGAIENKKQTQENEGVDAYLEQMLNWYAAEELDSLYQFAVSSSSEEFNKHLLLIRNQHMSERIATKIRNQTHFIAIGTAHLSGEKGVIALLEKEGFVLVPLSAPTSKKEKQKSDKNSNQNKNLVEKEKK